MECWPTPSVVTIGYGIGHALSGCSRLKDAVIVRRDAAGGVENRDGLGVDDSSSPACVPECDGSASTDRRLPVRVRHGLQMRCSPVARGSALLCVDHRLMRAADRMAPRTGAEGLGSWPVV
jgi:hypothetical protein